MAQITVLDDSTPKHGESFSQGKRVREIELKKVFDVIVRKDTSPNLVVVRFVLEFDGHDTPPFEIECYAYAVATLYVNRTCNALSRW
jgi:hypothetical protein